MQLNNKKNNSDNWWKNEHINSMQNNIQDSTKDLVENILNIIEDNKLIVTLVPWIIAIWLLNNELIWISLLLFWLLWLERWEKISTLNKSKTILENIFYEKTNDNLLGNYLNTLKATSSLLAQWLQGISSSYSKIQKIPSLTGINKEDNVHKILENYNENQLKIFFDNTVIPEIKNILLKIDENKYRL